MTQTAQIWHRLFSTNANHQALAQALEAGLVPDPNLVVDGLPMLHAFLRAQACVKLDEPKRGLINVWGYNDVLSHTRQPREPAHRPQAERSACQVVQALLAAGANPFATTTLDPKWGQDALDAAVALGQPSVVEVLLNHPLCPPVSSLLDRTGPNGARREPWLHALAAKGQAAVMQVLLDHGWPVDGLSKKGTTALFEVRNLDGLLTLLEHGASTAVVSQEGLGVVEAWGARPQSQSYWTMTPKELTAHLPNVADNPALLQQAVLKDVISATSDLFDQSGEFTRLTNRLDEAGFDAATWRINGVGKFAGAWTPVSFLAVQALTGRARGGLMPWKVLLHHPRGLQPHHEVLSGVPEQSLLWLGLWKAVGRIVDPPSSDTFALTLLQARRAFLEGLEKAGVFQHDPSEATLEAIERFFKIIKGSTTQVNEARSGVQSWLAWKRKFRTPSDLLGALWSLRRHGLHETFVSHFEWWETLEAAYSKDAGPEHQAMWGALAILSPSQPSQTRIKELLASLMHQQVDWAAVSALVEPHMMDDFKKGIGKFPLWQTACRAYALDAAYAKPLAPVSKPRF